MGMQRTVECFPDTTKIWLQREFYGSGTSQSYLLKAGVVSGVVTQAGVKFNDAVPEMIKSRLSQWKNTRNGKPTAQQFIKYAKANNFKVNYSTISKLFKDRPDLGTARRRMAQREFSDRRDSPVM